MLLIFVVYTMFTFCFIINALNILWICSYGAFSEKKKIIKIEKNVEQNVNILFIAVNMNYMIV